MRGVADSPGLIGVTRRWAIVKAVLAARRMTLPAVALYLMSYAVMLGGDAITIPVFDASSADASLSTNSGLVVTAVLPVLTISVTMVDPEPWIFRGAVRTPYRERSWVALMCLGLTAGGAWIFTSAGPTARHTPLLVPDSIIYLALALAGVRLFGRYLYWLPPLAVALLLSVPGLVPARINVLYLDAHVGVTAAIAVIALLVVGPLVVMQGSLVPREDASPLVRGD